MVYIYPVFDTEFRILFYAPPTIVLRRLLNLEDEHRLLSIHQTKATLRKTRATNSSMEQQYLRGFAWSSIQPHLVNRDKAGLFLDHTDEEFSFRRQVFEGPGHQ